MQSTAALIVRLARAHGSDRKLDSELLAAVLGPTGCVLDPIEMLDGWDIQLQPNSEGEAALWREAADVPALTSSFDAACELIQAARPHDAAALMARALRQLGEPDEGETGVAFAARAGCFMLVELLRASRDERGKLAA